MAKPPLPVCKAFLICNQFADDPNNGTVLIGMPLTFTHHRYPAGQQYAFFVRLTSAHGDYALEIQLQEEGKVVWSDGPPEPWHMKDPLMTYDLRLILVVTFPKDGVYDLVLAVNGEEVARQRFLAHLAGPAASAPEQ